MKATLNKTGKIILKTSAKLNKRLTRFAIKDVVTNVTISLKIFFILLLRLIVNLDLVVLVISH